MKGGDITRSFLLFEEGGTRGGGVVHKRERC